MNTNRNFFTKLHVSTKRDYLERMMNNKVKCMQVARKFDKNFWDGKRQFGYGGYNYIPGRWKTVAQKIIKTYKLKPGSKILDVGCGKGFLLYDLISVIKDLKVYGFDISKYAIKNCHPSIKKNLFVHDVRKKINYPSGYFDLVFSFNTLHNLKIFELKFALNEIERIAKKKYILVESYRNEKELFNLQCWALTCNAFFSKKEWLWIYNEFGYSGDYEFIYF